MRTLNNQEINQVNGGILFAVVPLWMAIGVVATELAVIAAVAADAT